MGLKRVSWVRRYQGQCRALRPLGHQGYRLRNHKKDQPLCSGYSGLLPCNRCIVVDLSCDCEACSLNAPGVVTPDTAPDISEPN